MKNAKILFFLLIILQLQLVAQNDNDRLYIIEQTNTKALNTISDKSEKHYFDNLDIAIKQGIKMEISNSRNMIGYLSGFDKDGNPIYDFDDNIKAASTNRVDKIWVGGSSGLDLNGSEIEIGHWEGGGLARITHQEITGKVSHSEIAQESDHATHMACTMIGTGVNSSARGMASEATILSRRSNNDEAEIAEFGAQGGILSNHSYSTSNSDGNGNLFGVYTNNAKEWDEIMYNAPYLTMCKSAGNDRLDGVNTFDNGYDLMLTIATSKNLITVGAVHDVITYNGPQSVEQSSFGSWGPTDDWRVKPDIVANGISVYSASNGYDADYSSKNGTSSSTATTTGAIALLQQHYHNENGVYMKSATVKALVIGTADEAGENDGPDFQNGWGLFNAESAAEMITSDGITSRIDELSLSNGTSYTTTIEVDGTSPLSLTMAWTDPSGLPNIGTDNQTPLLVNDLDVRISKSNTTYEPWLLSPNSSSNNFTDAAIKGDNFRDNIERIDVDNLEAGTYKVSVKHKGNLEFGHQDFSMVIKGIVPLTNIQTNPNFSLYPNPIEEGFINIALPNSTETDKYKVQVFDTRGRLLINSLHHEKQISLDVNRLVSGLFYIRIILDDTEHVELIRIEH